MKPAVIIFFSLLLHQAFSQEAQQIHTADVKRFWMAYDSVRSTKDSAKQIDFLQRLYIDKASEGLSHFIALRGYTAAKWLRNIHRYPKFWISVRPQTEAVAGARREIEGLITSFKKIYPAFTPVNIYFTVGGLNTGGTTAGNRVLIGSEMTCADSTTDASELSNWHRALFKQNTGILEWLAHEIVHTQQKEDSASANLLNACLFEGACDFIAELLLKQPLNAPYMIYGRKHHKTLLEKFQTEIYSEDFSAWLYNGDEAPAGQADLGYYMGYAICKAYYEQSSSKTKAVAAIIGLDYTKRQSVLDFYRTALRKLR